MNDINYLTDLQNQVQQGKPFNYLCFWGHTPKNQMVVDQSCLSQWFPSIFEVDGIQYQSAEQFMMAKKAELFKDTEIFQQIIASADPKQVKALGRLVKGYDDVIWQQQRFDIVVQGNCAKFSQNSLLKQFLIGTGTQVLVEASPVDKIWGIGLAADHADAKQPLHWKGLNLLGFALMQARVKLL